MTCEPTFDSIKQHRVPEWFHDEKLSLFIHWGLYSVSDWTPEGADIYKKVGERHTISVLGGAAAEWLQANDGITVKLPTRVDAPTSQLIT